MFPSGRRAVVAAAAVALLVGGFIALRVAKPPENATRAVPQELTSPLQELAPLDRPADSPFRFEDVAERAGVRFEYYGGPSPERHMTEQNGGGVALFDFDGDGWLDLFFANGSYFDRPAEEAGASQALYRAAGPLQYEDVTRAAGLEGFGFGMGCAAGDFDNDGFPDLFLAGYGRNRLWRNNGDGTFSEVALDPEADASLWGTSAAFADLDGDGNLDLYVVNYVDWTQEDGPCYTHHQPPVRISCGPLGRPGQPDRLYRNRGDGMFEDVSETSGIGAARGKGLAVAVGDFDGDGRLDVYVANDTTPNQLYLNQGGMRFEDEALLRGAAVGDDGIPRAGMGIAVADWSGNGWFDLVVTNFLGEPNDFFENAGAGTFHARNTEAGLDTVSRPVLGFGTVFGDFNLDGFPDLFVANGHVWDLGPTGLGYAYEMPAHLFRNDAGRRFADVSRLSGDYFTADWLGRAVAVGDLDNDGLPDLVVTHLDRPPALLRNASEPAGRSVRLRLIGRRSARQPLGARVEYTAEGRTLVARIPAGDSFQASHDPRVLLAIGEAQEIDELRITWPDGTVETRHNLPVQPEITLIEGGG